MKPLYEARILRNRHWVLANGDIHREVYYAVRCFPNAMAMLATLSFSIGCAVGIALGAI